MFQGREARCKGAQATGTDVLTWEDMLAANILDGIGHTSLRYMVSGSAVLAPNSNATVGDVGDSNASY